MCGTDFGASKDAAARAYATHHHECIAIVVVKDGCPVRYYPSPRFPLRKPVPVGTVYYRPSHRVRVASDIVETLPDNRIDVPHGKRPPTLYEQIYLQSNGFALIMLWAEGERPLTRTKIATPTGPREDCLARWRG